MNTHFKKLLNVYGEMDMQINNLKRIVCLTVIIGVATLSTGLAQSGIEPNDIERVGLSGWQFLKITANAKHSALGGTFVANSQGDAGAVFGNPSALVDVENSSISLGQVNWFADISYQTASIAKNFGSRGVIALSVATLSMGDIVETINSEIVGESRTEAVQTGNTFTGGDLAAGLSYAQQVTDNLSIGGNLRYVEETVADLSMSNVSMDIGTTYNTGWHSLRLAMVARNLGADQTLAGWSEDIQAGPVEIRMPIDFRIGVSMNVLESEGSPHVLGIALEGSHPNDGPEKINAGLEYTYAKRAALRAGYRYGYDEESLTFGAGVNMTMGNYATGFNYALVPFGRLGLVHMFTIDLGIN